MSKSKSYETIVGIVAGFLVIYLITNWMWVIYLVSGVSLLSAVSYRAANYLARGWLWMAEKIGWLSNRILLSIVYLIILTPVALAYRLFRKRDPSAKSSWQAAHQGFDKSDFEKPW